MERLPGKVRHGEGWLRERIPFVEYTETGSTWTQRNAFQNAALAAIQKVVDAAPNTRNVLGNHTDAAPGEFNDSTPF